MEFQKLFESNNVGSLELKNRIIMPPCTTGMAKDGYVTEKMKNHYAVIAQGGVAMITVEDGMVDSTIGRHDPCDLYVDDDKYIPGLTQLANLIKLNGAKAAIQINHGGSRSGKILNGYLAFFLGERDRKNG